jgi:hypothetical protein
MWSEDEPLFMLKDPVPVPKRDADDGGGVWACPQCALQNPADVVVCGACASAIDPR